MGNYPAGVGGVHLGFRTDSDPVTDGTPTDTNYRQIVNAAGQMSGAQSNALGSELLTGSMSETNNGFDPSGNGTEMCQWSQSRRAVAQGLPQNGSRLLHLGGQRWLRQRFWSVKGRTTATSLTPNNIDCAAAGVG